MSTDADWLEEPTGEGFWWLRREGKADEVLCVMRGRGARGRDVLRCLHPLGLRGPARSFGPDARWRPVDPPGEVERTAESAFARGAEAQRAAAAEMLYGHASGLAANDPDNDRSPVAVAAKLVAEMPLVQP